jgi:hypothetical protein
MDNDDKFEMGVPMPKPAVEKRVSERIETSAVTVKNLTSLDHAEVIAKSAILIDASHTGFLLHVSRPDLLAKFARESLTLNEILGSKVILLLEQMNLELSGTVVRTKRINKSLFEVAIDYTDEAPDYWRECLIDLLPRPGELD